jgi:citronellol/citronellal dehydrogenase
MAGRFAGRRALITGSSRGIGAAAAERLAAEGADVAITARTKERHEHLAGSLDETATRLARYGGQVASIVADLTDERDRLRIVPEAVEALGGPIDILVNNAAAAMYAPVAEFSPKRRRILFEANVFAPADLAAAVAPAMIDLGRGWIVNVSSGAARHAEGPPFQLGPRGSAIAMYGASKAALNRMSNGLGAELAGTGIRVNTVEPRAAVMSEGAAALVGDTIRPDQIEPLELMVEAIVALCACPAGVTGRSFVSIDLVDEWQLEVHGLDGQRPITHRSTDSD